MAHQDGRCATDAETFYVQGTPTTVPCSAGGGGTAAQPLCVAPDFSALTPARSLVVIRGQIPSGFNWNFLTPPTTEISVVGQNTATIESGAAPGIRVSGAPIYLRGLTVENGTDVGIIITGNSEIRMDRVIVQQNTRGGLLVMGSGFDVTNSIFVKNGGGAPSPVGVFGGVYLDVAPAGGLHRFAFNTIADNPQVGILVVPPLTGPLQPIVASLLYNNPPANTNGGNLVLSQTIADASATYHLLPSSLCRNVITPTQLMAALTAPLPLFDIDGDPRPQGPATTTTKNYDCGADEFSEP